MEIESTHIAGRGWRGSTWLVLVDIALLFLGKYPGL